MNNIILSVVAALFLSPSHLVIAPLTEPGQRIVVSGRVLDANGRPVPHVDIRAYHTDARGLYRADGSMYSDTAPPRLRGTLRTADDGSYVIETIRPAPYPSRTLPAHIHFELRPPTGPHEYAILYFADDPLLTAAQRKKQPQAICHLVPAGKGVLRCTRDFHLGKEADE
jgi:protocatechuate 3,4-dioxygenase beta subunit